MTDLTSSSQSQQRTRRDALRLGGITLSLSAIVAACGDGRTGDDTAGRVGNATVVTTPPDLAVDDAVRLRTASSLEFTAIAVLTEAKDLGALDGALLDRLISNHEATAAELGEMTASAGGSAWTAPNPWIMERSIEPILATIEGSDDAGRDMTNLVITVEDLLASTNQELVGSMGTADQRIALMNAAAQESRHSAALTLAAYGTANRFSPLLTGGEEVRTAAGTLPQFAINSTFGSLAQLELVVGAPDENGTRETYLLSTPAANSLVYAELDDA